MSGEQAFGCGLVGGEGGNIAADQTGLDGLDFFLPPCHADDQRDALQAIELHRNDAVGQLRTYGPSLRVDEVPAYGGDRALRPDFLDHVWCDIGVEHRTEAVAFGRTDPFQGLSLIHI